ncbi:MAG TPA: hypothetical protein VNO24_10675 [Blastocatellia bacterium]|nr:hypothetical protein [Blastocatellia bacterium]
MKKLKAVPWLIAWILCQAVSFAAGSVTATCTLLGTGPVWLVTYAWIGDSSNGGVPATSAGCLIRADNVLQGYSVTQAETIPGSPAPTANYAVTITDANGVDIAGGQLAALSSSAAAMWTITAPPLNGTLTLNVTGSTVNSAQGKVLLWLAPGNYARAKGGSSTPASVIAGDVTGTVGNTIVGKINGTSLAGLATGMMKNTTGTGIPSIGTPGVDYALPGPPTVSGYQPNQKLTGCGVEYVSGLIFNIGACSYTISGVTYSSATISKTLGTADATNPRIDVIAVDTSQTVIVLAGTPGATPQQPTLDPSTQLGLTFIYVPANSSSPQGVTISALYDEGSGEWTGSTSANLAFNTSNPFRGTHNLEATNALLSNYVTFTKPAAGVENLTNWNTLNFYIQSKGQWPNGNGANAARVLNIFWTTGSGQVGSTVVLKDGAFGFSSSLAGVYQQINIPISLFGTGSTTVTTLKMQVAGSSGSTSIGFYMDAVSLQGGVGQINLPTTLVNFRGAWSSSASYSPNDLVTSGGIGYVALLANTNIAVTTTADWSPLATLGGTTNQNIRQITIPIGTIGGSALTGTIWACSEVYLAGTIQQVDLHSDVSGSATVDVFTVAAGSWTGTASTSSITASAIPALSSAQNYSDATLTGWSKTLSGNQMVCGKLTGPATLGWVALTLKIAAN